MMLMKVLQKAPFLIALLALLGQGSFGQSSSIAEAERYRRAAEYSRDNRGVAMLVMKGDKVVFEDNALEFVGDIPWIVASGTKSFSGVLCAAAIDDKLISGFDEKVADTITEWKTDPRKSRITIRQLLSLTSGIDAGQITVVPTYADAVDSPATHEPGTHFEYGPIPFQIFGEIMTRKLRPRNETVKSYLQRRILDPIGMNVAYWRSFGDQPLLPQGLTLRASEWAKLGLLLKNRGKWNGKQIISANIIDELVKGSKVNPAYGLTFWLNADGTGPSGGERPGISGDIGKKISASLDIYMASGAGNQRLYVIPSQDLVVVRFGIFGRFDDREFISRLLTGK
jgi:CubicO group peptidase (beta-lactamase class C family)